MNLLAIWVKSDAPHCKMGDPRIYCLLLLKLHSSKLWDAARYTININACEAPQALTEMSVSEKRFVNLTSV
jgi:hypothetical protein